MSLTSFKPSTYDIYEAWIVKVRARKKAVDQVKQTKLFTSDDDKEINAKDREIYEKSVDEFYQTQKDLANKLRHEKKRADGGLIHGKGGELVHTDEGKADHIFDGSDLWKRDTLEEREKQLKDKRKKEHWRF